MQFFNESIIKIRQLMDDFLQATGENNIYCLYRGPNLENVAGDNEDIENKIF